MNNYMKKITVRVEAACLLSVSSIFTWLAALFKKQKGKNYCLSARGS